jgi:hypothetical protein
MRLVSYVLTTNDRCKGAFSCRRIQLFRVHSPRWFLLAASLEATVDYEIHFFWNKTKKKKNSMLWVRERTIPTERPPLVGVSSRIILSKRMRTWTSKKTSYITLSLLLTVCDYWLEEILTFWWTIEIRSTAAIIRHCVQELSVGKSNTWTSLCENCCERFQLIREVIHNFRDWCCHLYNICSSAMQQ